MGGSEPASAGFDKGSQAYAADFTDIPGSGQTLVEAVPRRILQRGVEMTSNSPTSYMRPVAVL
jgi:hypothetical protein